MPHFMLRIHELLVCSRPHPLQPLPQIQAHAIAFPGLSINGFTIGSNSGIVFAVLDDFAERKSPELSGGAIAMKLNQKFAGIQDAFLEIEIP